MKEWISIVWSSVEPFHSEIVGLAFTLIAAIIISLFRARVKLIYGRANNSRNVISVPDREDEEKSSHTEIYVEKFYLQNVGKKPATSVEFVLSAFPSDITIWEPRKTQITNVEKGNCLVSIPQVAPKELVIIDCVYLNQKAALVASVKCAECVGKEVSFWTLRRYPRWVNFTVLALMALGVAFVIQIASKLAGN